MSEKNFIVFVIALIFALPQLNAQSSFVSVKGRQFMLNNKPYYYIGANYWYGGLLALVEDPAHGRKRLTAELDFLHAKGINNLRVMAGVEGSGKVNGVSRVSPSLQPQQGLFDTALLSGLDFLLVEMGKRNMKAVLFLSNNWEWSGGFLQYLNWNGLLPDSIMRRKLTWDENRDIVSQFYTCAPCMNAYYEQVKLIVGRTNSINKKAYNEDPAIMAWELANEPRPMRLPAVPHWEKWIAVASALIRSMDAVHLITIGNEGSIGSENLKIFERSQSIKNIDYLTIHIWPKNWGWFSDTSIGKSYDAIRQKTATYVNDHIHVANLLKKPLVIEEFGLPRDKQSFDPLTATDLRDKYFRLIFSLWNKSRLKGGAIGGCNFWGFSGSGRRAPDDYWWSKGDEYMTDPPSEEQGINSVFDTDASTWKAITSFTEKIKLAKE
ncbi:beta-galactosidase [soil metagenome]